MSPPRPLWRSGRRACVANGSKPGADEQSGKQTEKAKGRKRVGAVRFWTAPTRFLSGRPTIGRRASPRESPGPVGSDAVCARGSPENHLSSARSSRSCSSRAVPSSEPEQFMVERANGIRAEAVEEDAIDSVFQYRETRTVDWDIRKTSNRTTADEIPKAAFATGPKSIWPRQQTYS